ncbi:MAG: UPF0149 family protein [Alphaproteobacteria bacterium]|nr:UPF0149 family protein [Alphaproteobacteria bacterium]
MNKLDLLEDFLTSERAPDNAMRVSELDGLLTGLTVGPERVPPAEWLPVAWGGGQPAFADEDEARAVIGTMLRRQDAIALAMRTESPDTLLPVFWEGEDGRPFAAHWAQGFAEAIRLRAQAWERLVGDAEANVLLTPILALCPDSPLAKDDPAEMAALEAAAPAMIPHCVLGIHHFWQAPLTAPNPLGKAGRNDPCPCGSGRKVKHCCGK